jgi:glycerol uptake facilitator-like aquaporin
MRWTLSNFLVNQNGGDANWNHVRGTADFDFYETLSPGGWSYAVMPVIGPLIGAGLAGYSFDLQIFSASDALK